ncbi:antitoxin Xre/MbcA/ParS toxin-binding domain-containing protein [Flavihumibacter petaseus]|uniref:Antitoxin Xre/MbcA/ParS-like toxin-binding domain-containing protein n=1 Tax=Flavihumibacter petaseus NBRC 106054 TaxID=1220578 RepID=A0A0E9MXF8_9BACT|nr:MbcA/ParS/Xre antitoxin family protein [Flavihumibacter petaseus]GAO42299.1 hypothetical protein FPE01S_01_13120 [Flavihumibacter petaseus NBRC 106054]
MATTKKKKEYDLLDNIPASIDDGEILNILNDSDVNWQYVAAIKKNTEFTDNVISDWLNVSVKTFREYKKPNSAFKANVKEHVVLLLSLMKHGKAVFGSTKAFDEWLNRENFYFDHRIPMTFMNTITGIKFIDHRLTAMEYGDNV